MSAPCPHSDRYWSEVETWPPERIREFQLHALRRQLARVGRSVGHYREQWQQLGFEPGGLTDLDQLSALPFTAKGDYATGLEQAPPWGTMVSVDPTEIRRVHFSSGTSGGPTPMAWTGYDLDRWAQLYARAGYSQGARETDVYQCMFGYPWFVGGLGATAGYQLIGSTVIPGGSGDTERQIETIFRYGTTAVSGTPSFMLHLAETAERLGTPLADSQVQRVQVGGEPGAGVPATRRQIESRWGARCYDGYGSLEFQPIAWECAEQAGGHLMEDFLLAEVLDPESKQPVPDGTPGVLVLTHLDKRADPLIRWWSGDVVTRDGDACGCGRTHARLPGGVVGRSDDMLVIRGVNVFPSSVEQIVRRSPGFAGEFQIVLDREVTDPASGYLTGIKIRVEADGDATAVASTLAADVRAELTVRCVVDVVSPGALPRNTHKARRVIRETT